MNRFMTGLSRRAAPLAVALFALAPAQAQPAAPAKAPAPHARIQNPGVLPGASARTPVEIDAKNLQWRDAERMADYSGGVVVTQGEATLHAERLRIYLAREAGSGVNAAAGLFAPAAGSTDIRRIEADGPVTVIQKDQIGAGDRGEYDKARGQVLLIGHVVLTQGANATSGARLSYHLASRNLVVDGGRVRSKFVQAATPGKPAAPQRDDALMPGANGGGPILVDADRLEWFDGAQKAIYTGHVAAKQGDSSLTARRLTIYVTRDPGAGASQGGRVRRIEADGPVTVIQKDQVATGRRAIFDKARNQVDLIGNVTLSQGPNVTTGSRLVYDLTRKTAVMVGVRSGAQAVFTPSGKDKGPFARAGERGKPAR